MEEKPAVGATSRKPRCGVIMPISAMPPYDQGHWARVLQILKDATSEDFEVELVSASNATTIIQKTIVQNLYENELVICDVSGKNPNVMFELGIRLTFDRPTVIIKDDITEYNFDTGFIEHLGYRRDLRFQDIVEFQRQLSVKCLATYDKSQTDRTYSPFLKHLGTYHVSKLPSTDMRSDEYLVAIVDELKDELTSLRASLSRDQQDRPQVELVPSPALKELASSNRSIAEGRAQRPWYSPRTLLSRSLVFLGLIAVVAAMFIWTSSLFPNRDEVEIRQVIAESQKYETLVLYQNPGSVNEEQLDKYWTRGPENDTSFDREKIRVGAQNLASKGRRYGSETKAETFEIQSLEVSQDRSLGIVKTLEKWFVAEYGPDGELIRNKTVGPYFVSYFLRKVDGKWLIEKSTTARISPAAPRLTTIKFLTMPKPNRQFQISLTGEGFHSESILLQFTGPGCPEEQPCLIPNSALQLEARIDYGKLDRVPVTLEKGTYKVTARNGSSVSSEALDLVVP